MTSSALALSARSSRAFAQHPLVVRYAPVATMVAALIAIWYVAAVAMNWSLVRDGFERGDPVHDHGCARGHNGCGAAAAAGAAPGCQHFPRRRIRLSATGATEPRLSFAGDAVGDRARVWAWRAVRHRAGADDRAQPRAGAQPAALDHLLAD